MTEADPLIRAKRKKKADGLFGQIAIKLQIVTREQLDEALELQRYAKEDKALGVVLMDLKYVGKEDLERIIQAQKAMVAEVGNRQKKVREDALFGKVPRPTMGRSKIPKPTWFRVYWPCARGATRRRSPSSARRLRARMEPGSTTRPFPTSPFRETRQRVGPGPCSSSSFKTIPTAR